MSATFLFADQSWLWALPALLVLAPLLWMFSHALRRRRMHRFITPELAARVAGAARRQRAIAFSVMIAVFALLLLALARPLSGPLPGTAERSGVDLVILLDVSKSMLVEDVAPSRLKAVKEALREWLRDYAQDRIALVPFAGDAFIMSPLTFDYQALDFVLREVGPRSLSAGGSNLPVAIDTAVRLLGKSSESARVILLVTDGENLEGDAVAAARKAHTEAHATVLTVGVGTSEGGQVPADDYSRHEHLPPGKRPARHFVRNEYGTLVTSRIDERALRSIASAGGGRYYPFAPGTETFRTVQTQSLVPIAQEQKAVRIDMADYREWFQLPLGGAILLLLLAAVLTLLRQKAPPDGVGVPVVRPDSFKP